MSVGFYFLYHKVVKIRLKFLKGALVGFSSLTTLMWILVSQNAQYLTLRSFLQLTALLTSNTG
jgi:hypothetical protein